MSLTLVPSNEPLSNRDKNMLHRAMEIAKQGTCKQRHGAVVYKSGKVLAVGVNSTRNEHPTMEIEPGNYTYHAEVAAICAIPSLTSDGYTGVKDATIYVARVNRRGNTVYSGPCTDCLMLMVSAGIKRVVFTV